MRAPWVALLACALSLLFAPIAEARSIPPLTGRVVDEAHVLSDADRSRVESLLAAHERDSGQQFALLTIPSLDGDALEDFSIHVVDAWKLGKKGKDDGLLLLVVKEDRKIRVEVGRGLEGTVTDAISSRVIRNVIGPAFRQGDYASGIQRGLEALMQTAAGKVPQDLVAEPEDSPQGQIGPAGGVGILLVIVLFLVLMSRRNRRYGGTFIGGSGFGGGFGGGGWGGGGGGGFGGGGGGFGGGGSSGSW